MLEPPCGGDSNAWAQSMFGAKIRKLLKRFQLNFSSSEPKKSVMHPQGHFLLCFFPFVGADVVVVKSGKRICGTGGAFSNAPIVQDKAYFEVKLQSTGMSY